MAPKIENLCIFSIYCIKKKKDSPKQFKKLLFPDLQCRYEVRPQPPAVCAAAPANTAAPPAGGLSAAHACAAATSSAAGMYA